uniref:Ground-like domain-containing protein n=1 Tax=Angiostrongylus cantonensis TaxID=6313 RepID=A0A0K0CUS5_ANGCA
APYGVPYQTGPVLGGKAPIYQPGPAFGGTFPAGPPIIKGAYQAGPPVIAPPPRPPPYHKPLNSGDIGGAPHQQGLLEGPEPAPKHVEPGYIKQLSGIPPEQSPLESTDFLLPETSTTYVDINTSKPESTYDDIVEEQQALGETLKNGKTTTLPASDADYTSEESDGGNCEDAELKAIVESALLSVKDNLDAARKIEADASAKFGGRFNAIVSDAEFAYVNWYGKRNCQLRAGNRHTLTWED